MATFSLRKTVAAATVVVLLAGGGPLAYAADPTEDELIKQGVEHRKRNEDAAALAVFRRAYDLHHTARAAAQMALAEVALGRWVDAEAHLEEALTAKADPWINKHLVPLQTTFTQVQAKLGSLEIIGGPPGAEILIEGEVRGTLPLGKPIRVRAGQFRLDVRAPAHTAASLTITITPGQLTRESVTLSPVAVAAGSPESASSAQLASSPVTQSARSSSGSGRRTTGIVLAGAGAAVIVTGIVFGVKARSAGKEASEPGTFNPDADSSGRTYQTLQYVGYGLGAALVAAGVATFVIGRPKTQDAGESQVSLSVLSGGGMASVGGTF